MKLDPNGTPDWQNTYGGNNLSTDVANSIMQTKDGGYIVAGERRPQNQNKDIWLLKLDANGIIDWQKAYGDSDSDSANSIQQTEDGGYIVAGSTDSYIYPTTEIDPWILKLNPDGTVAWQKKYIGIDWDYATSIHQTHDADGQENGYIVTGVGGEYY